MKLLHAPLVVAVVLLLAACGSGNTSESSVDFTWKKGPAPGTGSNVWVLAPGATDEQTDSICSDFQSEWPVEAAGEDQITVANDSDPDTSALVCVRVN